MNKNKHVKHEPFKLKNRYILLAIGIILLIIAVCFLIGKNEYKAFAQSINDRSTAEDYYTYSEIVEELGKPTLVVLLDEEQSGEVVWAENCENGDEIYAKMSKGKKVKAISIQFDKGKAIKAEYKVYK